MGEQQLGALIVTDGATEYDDVDQTLPQPSSTRLLAVAALGQRGELLDIVRQ